MTTDTSRQLPLDRLRDLLAVRENAEFQRLVTEVQEAATTAALHAGDAATRDEARQRYLAIEDIRNLMEARVGELQQLVQQQPQNAQ